MEKKKGGQLGVKKPTYKNAINIETFTNMLVLGCSITEITDEIGFSRQTYYKWMDDSDIMTEVNKRIKIVHTEGQSFIKARYKKYLSNIDKLCDDMTDKRTCLSANQYMTDRIDGKAGISLDVTVADVTVDVTDAKDLLKKYNKQSVDIEEE